jgi:hypothetical protein
MTISAASSLNSVYQPLAAQSQAATGKSKATLEQPADTVQLSPAATAHLKGADADGDGDGH